MRDSRKRAFIEFPFSYSSCHSPLHVRVPHLFCDAWFSLKDHLQTYKVLSKDHADKTGLHGFYRVMSTVHKFIIAVILSIMNE